MRMNKKEENILKKYFSIYKNEYSNGFGYELEQWTSGGVDMIISIDGTSEESVTTQFINYIDNFDIDEEIDLYRQDKSYKDAFTIKESLLDFEDWLKFCENIKNELLET